MSLWEADRPELYEDREAWDRLSGETDARLKTRVIASFLPEDTKSVVDVGCGNGMFVNSLPEELRVVGVDRSSAALQSVKREAVQASVTSLPFRDGEFDAVVCSEVLEHLPSDDFDATVAEIKRVGSKTLVITVPRAEDLWTSVTRCRSCGLRYNRHGHVRSFTRESLERAFGEWVPTAYAELGAPAPLIPSWLSQAHATFGNETVTAEGSVCPRCATEQNLGSPNAIDRLYGRWSRNAVESGRVRPYWMLAVFKVR